MTIAVDTIRERLINYIEHVGDKKVKAFYTIIQTDLESENIYSPEFKSELDKRYEDYKTGKSKMITATDSKKKIQKLLKSKVGK
jgi:hypothetical protein